MTGEDGECSVSYVAANNGIDAICALAGGPTSTCSEWPDWEDWDGTLEMARLARMG